MRRTTSTTIPAALAGLIGLGTLLAADPAASAQTPFEIVKGSWGGGGSLTLAEGKRENLSCNAYYTSSGGGHNLGVALRCAGQTSKFELRSHLQYDGGKVSGSWEERTFNASGNTSGTLNPGSMRLNFHGGISGNMSVSFSAASQSISIKIDTGGSAVAGVRISLRRR